MKTLGGRFVLINGDSKKEMFLDWKRKNMNRTIEKPVHQPMNYRDRKKLVSELQPIPTHQKITIERNLSHKNLLTTSTSTNKIPLTFYANPERQSTTISDFRKEKTTYRSRSLSKGLTRLHQASLPQKQINNKEIREKGEQASKYEQGRVICILNVRWQGLRYKLLHKFSVLKKKLRKQLFIAQIKDYFFKDVPNNNLYFFHLSKHPINDISKDIDPKEYVIFCALTPKFNIPFEIQIKLFDQASALEHSIQQNEAERRRKLQQSESKDSEMSRFEGYGKELKRIYIEGQLRSQNMQKQSYDWQKIKDIRNYADKLIDNPSEANKAQEQTGAHDYIESWCNQHYDANVNESGNNQPEKNAFLDIRNHYPKQTLNKQGLEETLGKMQLRRQTKNIHEIKHYPVQNMMEKVKREREKVDKIKKQEQKQARIQGYRSQQGALMALDRKNISLVEQNIPYIMDKYGITRAEAHNLYNIYKSLQKISAMRLFPNKESKLVEEKGIDRDTFDEGLKTLEINPGEEVIKNICYFPQFISWTQFIKIISISLRKTTQSKLQAILEGICSSSDGSLTEQQISIMIGSSLNKIFGEQQPQLKKHFTHVVMKTLDTDNSGILNSQQLKNHILRAPLENLDLISYLILSS